ncbi:restriction modification system DNA specificity protein-containing protein [Stutzerimonas stutzeri TS44]|nr:restriction modification system DNA specificity protein-containing protein [Stutzerimonas stutzeri TS44]
MTDLAQLSQALLAAVPVAGSIGNQSLFEQLHGQFAELTEEQFWVARDALIEQGVLVKGRGRGGSVLRPQAGGSLAEQVLNNVRERMAPAAVEEASAGYVVDAVKSDDDEAFAEKMQRMTQQLGKQMQKGAELDQLIRQKLGGWGMSFDLPMLPESWRYQPLDQLSKPGSISYGVVQPGAALNEGVPIIRVNNFKDGRIELADLMRIDPAIEGKYGRTRLKGGEVLLTIVGSVGQVAVAPKNC